VVAGPRPNYGFRFNEKRDGYLVDEDKMIVVKRISSEKALPPNNTS
jgi:hypothetical protein